MAEVEAEEVEVAVLVEVSVTHTPARHSMLAPQRVPQTPQLRSSVWRSEQPPAQQVWVLLHWKSQAPGQRISIADARATSTPRTRHRAMHMGGGQGRVVGTDKPAPGYVHGNAGLPTIFDERANQKKMVQRPPLQNNDQLTSKIPPVLSHCRRHGARG